MIRSLGIVLGALIVVGCAPFSSDSISASDYHVTIAKGLQQQRRLDQ
jgi:hypothetical protein